MSTPMSDRELAALRSIVRAYSVDGALNRSLQEIERLQNRVRLLERLCRATLGLSARLPDALIASLREALKE